MSSGRTVHPVPSHTTMTDVARVAGVSIKSVSRVINNEPHVSQRLREKVEAAIAELDYVPDTAARSLAGARSFTIGVLFDNPSPNYTMKVLAGAYRACIDNQYHLRIDTLDSFVPEADLRRQVDQILRHSRCDGFILTPPLSDAKVLLDMLEARGVAYSRIAPMLDVDRSMAVMIDDTAAAAAVADLFWARGHRRIGIINGPNTHGAAVNRRRGFMERLLQLDPAILVSEANGGFSFEGGIAAGHELLAARRYPTAIFAANDDSAAGVIVACSQLGLKVPSDVSICGFDDSWIAKSVWPYLTTVHQPIDMMAQYAAQMVLSRVSLNETQRLRQLDFELILRDSVADAS
ncbi:substrate-binding domain-containing protein [Novosphingobium sp. FSY-8]|uniref:Substrate-binding domain-containing protein n=1 Tax=Novosphingobium ovatum TaxID=1908523 RepID=A0ABW9X8V5_9SPHN|nr:LacI family DNA-binding transcriptional regulator [Novosphingobium ovatum]NBC34964.1 substrate-binding domain-containing protein [Novosphingobium ovatum]